MDTSSSFPTPIVWRSPGAGTGRPHESAQPKLGALSRLEQIPQELVVHVVMILHFRSLNVASEQARAAVG